MLDKAEYSAFQSTLNSPIVSYRITCALRGLFRISEMGEGNPPSLPFPSGHGLHVHYRLYRILEFLNVDRADVWLYHTIRYDREFNVDLKAEYSALSSTRSQKKKLKQTTPVPL